MSERACLDDARIRSHELWVDVPENEIARILRLLDDGKGVEATKHFRNVTGCELGKAQAAIDAVTVDAGPGGAAGRSEKTVPLSAGTVRRIRVVFPAEQQAEASRLLAEECCRGLGADSILECVRRAALRMSRGKLPLLRDAVELANTDWRDVLVASGFADGVFPHVRWLLLRQWWPARR